MTRRPVERTPLDAADPVGRMAQTNPTLDEQQVARIATFGVRESAPSQTTLFRRSDRARDFFLVTAGSIEIFDIDTDGEERVIIVHGPGQFAGELDLFDDNQVLVSARTGTDSQLVRVRKADLRRLITAEPDLGETLTRAFILRRVALVRHSLGGVLLVGASHAADTQRLQRFLTRNSYPHRLLDVE